MQSLAFALEAFGSGAAVASVVAWWRTRSRVAPVDQEIAEAESMICVALSPDESVQCTGDLGHFGWHRHGDLAWFGSVWVEGPPAARPEPATYKHVEFPGELSPADKSAVRFAEFWLNTTFRIRH